MSQLSKWSRLCQLPWLCFAQMWTTNEKIRSLFQIISTFLSFLPDCFKLRNLFAELKNRDRVSCLSFHVFAAILEQVQGSVGDFEGFSRKRPYEGNEKYEELPCQRVNSWLKMDAPRNECDQSTLHPLTLPSRSRLDPESLGSTKAVRTQRMCIINEV